MKVTLLLALASVLSTARAAAPGTLRLRGGAGPEKLCGVRFPHRQAAWAGKVEVVGSWDGFQNRKELKKAKGSDDQWLTVLKLGAGTYQCKFVVNENQWMCSDSMEMVTEGNGNQNNVLHVDPKSSQPLEAAVDKSLRAYQPTSQPSLSDAEQILNFLRATDAGSAMLLEAQTQLVNILAAELKSGLGALQGCQDHLKTSQRMCKELEVELKSGAAATVSDIGSQLTMVKEMMDAKEKKAVDSVSATCQTRLEKMQGQLSEYNKTIPDITSLIQRMQSKIQEEPATSRDGLDFSDKSEVLLKEAEALSLRACQLPEPPVLHDFSHLSVDMPEA